LASPTRHILIMTQRRARSSKTAASSSRALSYTNSMGATYYLHEGRTKTGKPRFFVAKTVREGARAVMPDGYEFSESINGVVSVRRVSTGNAASLIPDTDLAMVRAELGRHKHLGQHRVEVVKGEIVVFEPMGGVDPSAMAELARAMFVSPEMLESRLETRRSRTRYDPVMKFVPAEEPGHYAVHRMTYRGEGGWSYPLAFGPLRKLVRKYLKHVGTEGIYELM
jgi:hypothetical protein